MPPESGAEPKGTGSVALPTGTVTFLFSDIEGSTERWERDRGAMSAALARHDALLRTAIEAEGGYVFKTVGDAFCAAFSSPSCALAAALATQRALHAADFGAVDGLRVRMALHTGSADEREGDYFGPPVNRVARLLALGHGGQILASAETIELIDSALPARCTLRDLGAHQLKDLVQPEHVYQISAPDLPDTFPALRSLGGSPNNLPPSLTPFIGREETLRDIEARVANTSLVTLVGAGGVGKTRCALQAASGASATFGDGAWFVDLGRISDGSLVPTAIAQAFNLTEWPNRPLLDTITGYLKRKAVLIVLDNCEHVLDGACAVVSAIRERCPGVHVLATSRERLNLAGEQSYRIPSLSYPSASDIPTPAQLTSEYEAVALFVDRASAADRRFALTNENAAFVADICRRLEGIPLAIELAAARIAVMSPQDLASKLDERFRLLTGGVRSALPRQQTMRALFDWSYELLTYRERAVFRKLAIFANGFTSEVAAAVCNDETSDGPAVFDVVTSLVDKSLVQAETSGPGTRYRLLESTREYAREKLIASCEEDATARAHAIAFLAVADRFDRGFETTRASDWRFQAMLEMENWRAALEWALGRKADVRLGPRLVCALMEVWISFAAADGWRWLRLARGCIGDATDDAINARLDLIEARLLGIRGDAQASVAAAERAVAFYREHDRPRELGNALRTAGMGLSFLGKPAEGYAMLRQALESVRAAGLRNSEASILTNLGLVSSSMGDLESAKRFYVDAREIAKAAGLEKGTAVVGACLAELLFQTGDVVGALRSAEEALAYASSLTAVAANLQHNMAAYLIRLDRFDEARARAREGIALVREVQADAKTDLQHFAAISALRPGDDPQVTAEDRRRAARLLGYVDARIAALGTPRGFTEQQERDRIVAVLHAALGDDEMTDLLELGASLDEDQAVGEALVI